MSEKDLPRRDVKLSGGRVAKVIVTPLGRHQHRAMRASKSDDTLAQFALVAELATIDGRRWTVEEVLDLPLADIKKITDVVNEGDPEGKGDSSAAPSSSP